MYEQDYSPMEKSIFQRYEPQNLLFSDPFRTNYAYNSPSAALYANSPLGGLGGNFASHSQQYAQSTFAAVALNALNNTTSGNQAQSTFGLHHHQNQLNESTPVRSEHTSLEETQNHLEEQNSAEEEHIAALQAQHNVQSSSTIPNYPNYNSSNNNINSAINSNNVTGSTNININGSNCMNFSAQQNFILKKHLNDQPHQQQTQQNQNSQIQIPAIPTGSASTGALSQSQQAQATAGAASAQFMGNNQAFRFQYQGFDENLLQTHSNYPGTPYYDSLAQNNDNQNSINYAYNQHNNSPNYSYQQAHGTNQIQPTPTHQAVSNSQQNYSFSTAQSNFKKAPISTNIYYESPRNFAGPFLPYTPPITQQSAQSGFSQFIQNQQLPAEINLKQQQIFPEQDECSPFPFLSTPVHSIEQQQNYQQQQQQQQSQQQSLIPQSQSSKSGLNLLQKQQQLQQMQRYHQEKAVLQQQQMQYTEQALLEQQQQQHQQIQNQSQYSNFGHYQQQQQSQFSNLLLNGSKLLPIQPTPININQNSHNASKIAIQALKSKEAVEEQNYQETQESIQNEDEENVDQNGEESADEDNQDGDDIDEEDDEEYGGSKKKGNNGSNKIKKGISKTQRRNKHTSLSAISSSSLQNQTNNGSSTKMSRKQINETKNIPKNYSKAIIGYIQKHPDDCARLLGPEYSYDDFDKFLMDKKEKLTAIKDLRSLWTTNCGDQTQQAFNRVFRILSFKFFRENAVSYIYSSRKIKNTRALITYRFILQRALHDPESFSFMKFQN